MPTFACGLAKSAHTAEIITQSSGVGGNELLEKAVALRRQTPHFHGQSVAVVYSNLLDFVVALLAFDGWCEKLYLCSTDNVTGLAAGIQHWPELANQPAPDDSVHTSGAAPNISKDDDYELLDTRWFLASSGTSGDPKWFRHTYSSLTSGIRQSPSMQTLCWASLYQPHRFAGLQVLLQALLSGACIVDSTADDLVTQVQQYAQYQVSAISATPSMWRQLLRTNLLNHLPLINITLGGEIADQGLLDMLSLTFPDAKIRHIYASTEAGIGFVVADKLAGFPLGWLAEGVDGASLRIDHNQHLRIKSSASIDTNLAQRIDADGYLDTQDKVEMSSDRVLFMGRASGVINVGGNKVHPEKVESVVLQVPQVQQVRVFAKNNSVLGSLVMADVVVTEDADWLTVLADMRQQCKRQLQRFEIPVKFNQQIKIAVNPSGKLTRTTENG